MDEVRTRGWHPDPYGLHHERYYFDDGQPGRLVRDRYGQETFDDIPGDVLRVPSPGPALFASVGVGVGHHEVLGEEKEPVSPIAAARATPEDVAAPAAAAATVHAEWIDPPPNRWVDAYHNFKMPHRRVLVTAGVCALALVLVIVLVASLTSSSPSNRGSASVSNAAAQLGQGTLPPAPSQNGPAAPTDVQTAWQVTETFATAANMKGVTCAGAGVCVAAGETGFKTALLVRTFDGGSSWAQEQVPATTGAMAAVSCASAIDCVAVGGTTVLTTQNGGLQWAALPLGRGSLDAVSCSSVNVCVAGGSVTGGSGCAGGATYTSLDGGRHWATTTQRCFVPRSISCPSTTRCEVAGVGSDGSTTYAEILGTRDAGAHWQLQQRTSDAASAMTGISCPSVSVCEAVGSAKSGSILGTLNGGAAWTAQTAPADLHLEAVSCGSTLVCQAVGSGQQLSTKTGGTSWVRQLAPASLDTMNGVACPTINLCAGVASSVSEGGVVLRLAL